MLSSIYIYFFNLKDFYLNNRLLLEEMFTLLTKKIPFTQLKYF